MGASVLRLPPFLVKGNHKEHLPPQLFSRGGGSLNEDKRHTSDLFLGGGPRNRRPKCEKHRPGALPYPDRSCFCARKRCKRRSHASRVSCQGLLTPGPYVELTLADPDFKKYERFFGARTTRQNPARNVLRRLRPAQELSPYPQLLVWFGGLDVKGQLPHLASKGSGVQVSKPAIDSGAGVPGSLTCNIRGVRLSRLRKPMGKAHV